MQLKKQPFIYFIIAYLLLVIYNLNKIPVAWVDEIMLIDPAFQLIKHGQFVGTVWPFVGSEQIFLAYLPLSSFIHLIDLSLFPHTLFFTRLPWLIFLIITSIYLFKYIDFRYSNLPAGILFITCLFILDEGVSNAMRSGRVEMPAMAIMAAAFYYALKRKHPFLQALLVSLLFIAHPGVYPIAIILGIELLTRKNSPIKRTLFVLIMLAMPLLYLSMANFNFSAIYQQLIVHGKEHDGHDQVNNIFYQHFIQRFLPSYQYQFWIIALAVIAHFTCAYTLLVKKNYRQHIVEIAFLATSVFWFFTLAPFYRYTPILILLLYLHWPEMSKRFLSLAGYLRISFRAAKIWQLVLMALFIGYCSLPFFIRNGVAIQQSAQRNEYDAYQWINEQIKQTPNEKILIIDEPIAFYYAMQHDNIAYTLPYAVPKYRFENYDRVFYLTQRAAPTQGDSIAEYLPSSNTNQSSIFKKNIITYQGMRLYQIQSEQDLQNLYRK
jgi:hypothetical protein